MIDHDEFMAKVVTTSRPLTTAAEDGLRRMSHTLTATNVGVTELTDIQLVEKTHPDYPDSQHMSISFTMKCDVMMLMDPTDIEPRLTELQPDAIIELTPEKRQTFQDAIKHITLESGPGEFGFSEQAYADAHDANVPLNIIEVKHQSSVTGFDDEYRVQVDAGYGNGYGGAPDNRKYFIILERRRLYAQQKAYRRRFTQQLKPL